MVTWLILAWFLTPEGGLASRATISSHSREREAPVALAQKPPPEKPPPQKPPLQRPPIDPNKPGGPAAASPAAPSKSARGTVSDVSVDSLTIKSGDGHEWTFLVDSKTRVIGVGAGTKMAKMKKEGKGLSVLDLVGNGDAVTVRYQETNGKLRASELRVTKRK